MTDEPMFDASFLPPEPDEDEELIAAVEESAEDENEEWKDEFFKDLMPEVWVNGEGKPPQVNLTIESINECYENLMHSEFCVWDARAELEAERHQIAHMEHDLVRLTKELNNLKAAAILDGRNDGSNPEKREAKSRELFADQYAKIEQLQEEIACLNLGIISYQSALDEEELGRDIQKLNAKRVDTLLRFMELVNEQQATKLMIGTTGGYSTNQPPVPGIALPKKGIH